MLILTDQERLSNTIVGYIFLSTLKSSLMGSEVVLVTTVVNVKIQYLHDQIRAAESRLAQ
jgi:hypothetical protein